MTIRILIGDVREKLRELPDESVHCVVTSPPYYGLRDQCAELGVPFHFKQWGPRGVAPLLDGVEHKAFPCSSQNSSERT